MLSYRLLLILVCLVPVVLAEGEVFSSEDSRIGNFGKKIENEAHVELQQEIQQNLRQKRVPQFLSFQPQVVPVVERQVPVVPVVEQHIHHHHIDHVVTHEEEAPEIDVWDIRDSVPGTPNEDYPVLRSIPKTQFKCDKRISGYYADPDTKCQVFHRCSESEEGNRKKMDSFLCLNGTTFNQEILSCDWWENVQCDRAPNFYSLNQELNMRGENGKYVRLSARRASIDDKVVAPRIIPKDERRPLPPQFRSPLNRIQATEEPYTAEDVLEDETIIQSEGEIDANELAEEAKNQPSTEPTLPDDVDEDEVAFFFTPEQLKAIRTSRGFGEKLKKGNIVPTLGPATTFHPPMKQYLQSASNNTNVESSEQNGNTTRVYPIIGTSQVLIQSSAPKRKNREPYEEKNLFDEKIKEMKKNTIDLKEREKNNENTTREPTPETKKFRPRQRLRKIKARKIGDEKETESRSSPRSKSTNSNGLPFPREQIIVYPDGSRKLLKHKHLLHSDIQEVSPVYVSHVKQPIQPVYQQQLFQSPYYQVAQPYTINPHNQKQTQYSQPQNLLQGNFQTQFTYAQPQHQFSQPQQHQFIQSQQPLQPQFSQSQQPQFSQSYQLYQNGHPIQQHFALPQNFPHHPPPFMIAEPQFQTIPPTTTHEHHHHHTHGTYHKALEPHHVIPALYHNNQVPRSPDVLRHPHHSLAQLQGTLYHHTHARIPHNPISAEHYAAESHLAVAAFHKLHEPTPVFLQTQPTATLPIQQFNNVQQNGFPFTSESRNTPTYQLSSNLQSLSQYMDVIGNI